MATLFRALPFFSLSPVQCYVPFYLLFFEKAWNLCAFQRSDTMKRLFLNGFIIYHLPIEAYFVLTFTYYGQYGK